MFKKQKLNYKLELKALGEVLAQARMESRDGLETLCTASIELYLKEYSLFSRKVSEDYFVDENDIEFQRVSRMMNELRDIIIYQYLRNFSISENKTIYAKNLLDIPKVIDQVELDFAFKIVRAQKYFGEYLQKEFKFSVNVLEAYEPHSVNEIFERLGCQKYDWTNYTIIHGYPQPLFRDRFNKMLKKCIEDYISEA